MFKVLNGCPNLCTLCCRVKVFQIPIPPLFAEWAKLETFRCRRNEIKKRILIIKPVQNYTRFGFDVNAKPPDAGFFVDAEFTPVET